MAVRQRREFDSSEENELLENIEGFGFLRYQFEPECAGGEAVRAVPEIILGGRKHFFVLWVEGVLLTMCPRGGGWGGNLSWGSRCI